MRAELPSPKGKRNDEDATSEGVFRLLKEKRFAPFFFTQLLGAANDNVFKFAFTLLVTYHAKEWSSMDAALVVNLIAALFILPFLLFSATSGQIADKWDKTTIMRLVKGLEVGIMVLACIGLATQSVITLLVCTFLLGCHSTLFGPAKYAYLPNHLTPQEILGGNGLVEMGTFVAILAGTIAGGLLVSSMPLLMSTLLVISLLGLAAAWFMPKTPSVAPDMVLNWNPLSETLKNLKEAKKVRSVFLSMLGISWLWFFGAVFLTQFAPYAKNTLHANESVVTLLLALFSMGIAIGSVLCERLSGKQVEIGLVPFGSIGMTLFGLDFYWASVHASAFVNPSLEAFVMQSGNWRVMADLFFMAMFAGFYSVPLYALIQTRTVESHRSRIIAANNILNALFMIASAIVSMVVLNVFHWSIPALFLLVAAFNAVVAIYIYTLVPEFLIRFIAWMLIHSVYRVRKQGADKLPPEGAGPALLIANHVSFVDAIILMAISPRPIRFVMDHQIFKVPVLSFIFKHTKAIPIASAKVNPEMLAQAYDSVDEALAQGELVCIFPEGRITDTGQLYPFKSGVSQILARRPVPVYPIALGGLWGSFFSRKGGSAFSWKNMGWASTLTIEVGDATLEQDPAKLQQQVQTLLNSTTK